LYLVGHVGFRWRLSGELEHEKLALAAALLVLYAVGSALAGWVLAAAIAVLLAGLCALETQAAQGALFAGERAGKHQPSEDPVPPLVE
jgi:hypothetical protein